MARGGSARSSGTWTAGLGLALLAAVAAAAAAPSLPAPRPLLPGQTLEGLLAAGETRRFALAVPAGFAGKLVADQREADLILGLAARPGTPSRAVDHLLGQELPETLVLAPGEGIGAVAELRAKTAGAARFRLTLQALPDATAEDRQRLEAERAGAEGAAWVEKPDAAQQRLAAGHYERALALWRTLGERRQEALALRQLAALARRLGELPRAIELLTSALPLWPEPGGADRLHAAATRNDLGLTRYEKGDYAAARADLEQAIALFAAIPERRHAAVARGNLCLAVLGAGETAAAVECFERVLAEHRAAGDHERETETLINLGGAAFTLGEASRALASMEAPLAKSREAGNVRREAQILNNLGFFYQNFGELQNALAAYGQALERFEREGDQVWQARALNNLAYAYWSLGDLPRARPLFEQALELRRRARDQRGEIVTLLNLGNVELGDGELSAARRAFAAALELSRAAAQPRNAARALDLLGRADFAAGDPAAALDKVGQALAGLDDEGLPRAEALLQQSRYHAALGDLAAARRAADQAAAAYGRLRFPAGRAQSEVAIAELERRARRPEAQLRHAEAAIAVIESLRTRIGSPDLRASFLGATREAYELAIDAAAELGDRPGGEARRLRALELSEQARARTLLDFLREQGLDLPHTPDERRAAGGRLTELRRRLQLAAERRYGTVPPKDAQAADQAERAYDAALAALENAEAELRRADPRHAAAKAPTPRAADLQALAADDTVLAEYTLGDHASHLWVITPGNIEHFPLPPRSNLDPLARQAHAELSVVDLGVAESDALPRLSAILLGPLAARLAGSERLVVLADGATQYLPFGALPVPGTPGEILLDRHEVVHLPSAAALIASRALAPRRAAPEGELAIFADPVYQRRDPRLQAPPGLADPALTRYAEGEIFPRLPASRREAEAIAALLPAGAAQRAYDFDASRARLLAPATGRHRLLHVASHGVIDSDDPGRSGLVLSTLDPLGRPVDGFVRLRDLDGLELRADLVVLSGCRTALGRELRGEGLHGLTRGFLAAGAPRVVASLWPVPDAATAALMEHFYRAMLHEKLPAPAALRRAQLLVRAEPRWRDPFHWASFVLQGDWR